MEFEIGIDEAGRGAWAGPIVACAILKAKDHKLPPSIRDSKELSPKQRELAHDYLTKNFRYGIGIVEAKEIDKKGLTWANQECMRRALNRLKTSLHMPPSTKILIDGRDIGCKFVGVISPKYIIDGDRYCPIISAASIIAKVHRDNIMTQLNKLFPTYGFELHKGYGTSSHREKIEVFGPSTQHRVSYKPIKEMGNRATS